jgi:hypothetical protein
MNPIVEAFKTPKGQIRPPPDLPPLMNKHLKQIKAMQEAEPKKTLETPHFLDLNFDLDVRLERGSLVTLFREYQQQQKKKKQAPKPFYSPDLDQLVHGPPKPYQKKLINQSVSTLKLLESIMDSTSFNDRTVSPLAYHDHPHDQTLEDLDFADSLSQLNLKETVIQEKTPEETPKSIVNSLNASQTLNSSVSIASSTSLPQTDLNDSLDSLLIMPRSPVRSPMKEISQSPLSKLSSDTYNQLTLLMKKYLQTEDDESTDSLLNSTVLGLTSDDNDIEGYCSPSPLKSIIEGVASELNLQTLSESKRESTEGQETKHHTMRTLAKDENSPFLKFRCIGN